MTVPLLASRAKASPVYIEPAAADPAVIEVLKKRWPDVIGDRPKGSFHAPPVVTPRRGAATKAW